MREPVQAMAAGQSVYKPTNLLRRIPKCVDVSKAKISDIFNIYESLKSYGEETKYKSYLYQAIQKFKK